MYGLMRRNAKIGPRKCGYCRSQMPPDAKPNASACGIDCAAALGAMETAKKMRKQAKIDRANDKKKREQMKSRSTLNAELQAAINAFARARDCDYPCISCGGEHRSNKFGGVYDGGHYRSIGSASHMRFVEENIHKQCKYCNKFLSGNALNYEKGLIDRYGIEYVDKVKNNQVGIYYTKDELREKRKYYIAETKRLLALHK